jgi:hypothetical protein
MRGWTVRLRPSIEKCVKSQHRDDAEDHDAKGDGDKPGAPPPWVMVDVIAISLPGR